MEPMAIGLMGASICIVMCTIAAALAIKSCGAAVASVTSEKPELGRKLLITIILGEALAIYGLLIAIITITESAELVDETRAWSLLVASFTMGGSAIAASIGIAYCGPAMITAYVSKVESFSINILGLIMSEALAIYGLLISIFIIL